MEQEEKKRSNKKTQWTGQDSGMLGGFLFTSIVISVLDSEKGWTLLKFATHTLLTMLGLLIPFALGYIVFESLHKVDGVGKKIAFGAFGIVFFLLALFRFLVM